MIIARIPGATRVLGVRQGYLGLPVRDDLLPDPKGGAPWPRMTTAWTPTPAELEALNNGASVHVQLMGTAHPPILLTVGVAPDDEQNCPGHVASTDDPKVCGRCGVHIDSLRPPEDLAP